SCGGRWRRAVVPFPQQEASLHSAYERPPHTPSHSSYSERRHLSTHSLAVANHKAWVSILRDIRFKLHARSCGERTDTTMLGLFNSKAAHDARATLRAFDESQALIQFRLDGTILSANAAFLKAMGYSAEEIVGRHHSMFVDEAYKASSAYSQFWEAFQAPR